MDAKNAQIQKLKGEIKNENAQKTETKEKNDKEYDSWKEGKKKRLDELSLKIKQLDSPNSHLSPRNTQISKSNWPVEYKPLKAPEIKIEDCICWEKLII